jgi:hypothetical protein
VIGIIDGYLCTSVVFIIQLCNLNWEEQYKSKPADIGAKHLYVLIGYVITAINYTGFGPPISPVITMFLGLIAMLLVRKNRKLVEAFEHLALTGICFGE